MRSLHGTAARLFGLAIFAALPLSIAAFAVPGCTFDTPGEGSPSIGDEAGLLDTGLVDATSDARADAGDGAISVQDASIADADAGRDATAPDTAAPDASGGDADTHDSGKSDGSHDGGGPG